MNLHIAHDRENANPDVYFVHSQDIVFFSGSYIQCLCIVGAIALDSETTLSEINDKTDGFLYGKVINN